jgi:LPS-assembly protein
VRYDHQDSSKIIGERIRVNPFVSYPWRTAGAYFIPKLSLYYLGYSLSRIDPATQPASPSVTVPVYSVDTGLIFERNTQWAGAPLILTLEPRLFYLYAPYKDQSQLPLFDTGLTTFNDLTMFAENRFSGGDRIGDANQLAIAVSSRTYRSDSGFETSALTLGQLYYYQDRQVLLPGQTQDSQTHSSVFGTLSITPTDTWRLRGNVEWSPTDNHIEVSNTSMQYRLNHDSVFNLDYRYRRDELRTYGGSMTWRISPRWRLLGAHRFDVENNHKLENIFGVQYDSCCWAVKIVGVERFNTVTSSVSAPLYDQAVYLTVQLKGLSNFGQHGDVTTLLTDGIYGYTP